MSELAFEMGRKKGREDVFDELPDDIDIYGAIKLSGARKHVDIAKVIAGIYTQVRPSDAIEGE